MFNNNTKSKKLSFLLEIHNVVFFFIFIFFLVTSTRTHT